MYNINHNVDVSQNYVHLEVKGLAQWQNAC